MAEVRGGAEGALTESPGLQPNSIPDNKTNRECVLVLGRFDAHVIAKSARGVSADNSNALGWQRPPAQRRFSNTARYQKCTAGQAGRVRGKLLSSVNRASGSRAMST
jgi:hypothetical protein